MENGKRDEVYRIRDIVLLCLGFQFKQNLDLSWTLDSLFISLYSLVNQKQSAHLYESSYSFIHLSSSVSHVYVPKHIVYFYL